MSKDDGSGNINIGKDVNNSIVIRGSKNVINLPPSSGSSGDKLLQMAVVLLLLFS